MRFCSDKSDSIVRHAVRLTLATRILAWVNFWRARASGPAVLYTNRDSEVLEWDVYVRQVYRWFHHLSNWGMVFLARKQVCWRVGECVHVGWIRVTLAHFQCGDRCVWRGISRTSEWSRAQITTPTGTGTHRWNSIREWLLWLC